MRSNLMVKNAGLVARAEAVRLGMPIPPTFRFEGRTLVLSTGERFQWKQGSGWVRPDGSRADGRSPEDL